MSWDSSGTWWPEGVSADWLAHPALYHSGGDPGAPCRGSWHWVCPHVQDQLQSRWHSLDLLAEPAWETGKKRHPNPGMSGTVFWLRLEEEVHRLSMQVFMCPQTYHALVNVWPKMKRRVGAQTGISRLLRELWMNTFCFLNLKERFHQRDNDLGNE